MAYVSILTAGEINVRRTVNLAGQPTGGLTVTVGHAVLQITSGEGRALVSQINATLAHDEATAPALLAAE